MITGSVSNIQKAFSSGFEPTISPCVEVELGLGENDRWGVEFERAM